MAGKLNSLRVGFIIIIVFITNKNIVAIKEERETQTVWQHLRKIVTPRQPVELILSYSRPKCDSRPNFTSEVIKFSLFNFENITSTIKTSALSSTTLSNILSSTNLPETTTDFLTNIDDPEVEKFWHEIPNSEHASKSAVINEPDNIAIDEALDDFDNYDYILDDDSKTANKN